MGHRTLSSTCELSIGGSRWKETPDEGEMSCKLPNKYIGVLLSSLRLPLFKCGQEHANQVTMSKGTPTTPLESSVTLRWDKLDFE